MPADVRHAAGNGGGGDRRRLLGTREEQRRRRRRRERRDGRDGPGARGARGLRPRHCRERHDAVRPRGTVPGADHRGDDRARLVLRSPAGAGRDVRRPRAPEGRARSPDGVDAHESRYRHKARPQRALHRRDDPARSRVQQPHGGPDGALRQIAGPRGADRNGMLQREPRGGAPCDRSGRRERQAGDRDGAARGGEGGGGALAGGGRRVRPQGGGRPAAGLARVTAALAVGVMSGTSLDGVSTALVRLTEQPLDAQLVAFRQDPYATPERGQIIEALARGGERARRGKPSRKVLEALLADPYCAAPPPKSTGRERFGPDYAARLLDDVKRAGGSDNDAVATATALTVETIARGIERWTPARPSDELVISGGGARNPRLVELLTTRVAPRPVVPFEGLFFDGEAKEALVFAFLGFLTLLGTPGNLPAATGARGPRVLGHITPA